MCKTIKQKVKFKAPPEAVYQRLAPANQKIGGRFSAGRASGINVDLKPGKRIVQAWRDRDFPVGIFSMAAFTLSATPDGGTQVVLTHRGVPKEQIPRIEQAWRKSWDLCRRFFRN